jgi:hypothetical protein
MGKKNSPLIRYKILDQCFRNPGRKYFFEDLKEAIDSVLCEIDPEYGGISRRQLFDDIWKSHGKTGRPTTDMWTPLSPSTSFP